MSLRIKLLLPLLFAALLLMAQALLSWHRDSSSPALLDGSPMPWLALLALALLALAAWLVEFVVCRPLSALAQAIQQLAGVRSGDRLAAGNTATIAELAGDLAQVRQRLSDQEAEAQRSEEARRKLEEQLRDCDERYVLAVERANDGIWEWDLKSGGVQFSPRWRGMLGLSDAPLERIDDWKKLMHADDRNGIELRLDNHLQGLTTHFDAEYRLRHRDGHYRWVQSRGTAFRHASGAAYRLLVMDIDIHARKELEETLIVAAEGLSAVSGMEFFRALMRNLSEILGTRDNLVCYCPDDPPKHARTLAYYSRGKFWENFDYELEGTSCGAVIEGREIVYVPTGVCDIWPVEKQYHRDSYIGVPMFDSKGKIIGHFACMDGKAMKQDMPHLAIFKIFSVRAAAELERTLLRQQLGLADAG